MRFALGTPVRVQVSRVDLDGRRIDFRLITEGDALSPRGAKERSGAHSVGKSTGQSASQSVGKPAARKPSTQKAALLSKAVTKAVPEKKAKERKKRT
jgi:ribonuclease R